MLRTRRQILIAAGVVLVLGIAATVIALVLPSHGSSQSLSTTTSSQNATSASPTSTPPIPPSQLPTGPQSTAPPGTATQGVLSHQPPPSVTIPATQCTNGDLSAGLSGPGPYQGMGQIQLIVTITSTVPCQLKGYPTLQFDNATTSIQDGGTTGNADPPSVVAAGPGIPVSFLMQFSDRSSTCTDVSGLNFGLPSDPADIPVALDPPYIASWTACASALVSPIEQGNSVDRYA
jgi:hypothetical protein